ncbi:MAG: DMT family transporter [Thaumarchaeota archaeon]|nr:DMT family transporter [Nitrososphaerota archaeon]
MQTSARVRRGYLYAFLAAICGGATPTLGKFSLVENGPVQVSAIAFILSGLMLVLVKPKEVPDRKSLKFVVFFGLIGAALGPVLYQTGLNATTAVNASLLSNGEALFTTLIAFAVFGERLPGKQLARGLLIVVGIALVTTNLDLAGVQFYQGLEGNLLILGSMFIWSIENNLIISPTQRFGPALITKFRNLIGGGVVIVAMGALGLGLSLSLTWLVYMILLSLALAGTSYLAISALCDIGAIRAILVFSTSTIFGAVFALVFLREQITAVQLTGGALIMLGVYLLQRAERRLPIATSSGT